MEILLRNLEGIDKNLNGTVWEIVKNLKILKNKNNNNNKFEWWKSFEPMTQGKYKVSGNEPSLTELEEGETDQSSSGMDE